MRINRQKAFGLVELMLGLFLGTCLLALMARHYLTAKQQSADTTTVMARAYDQQLITELMRTSIRQAGFTPCAPIRWLTDNDNQQAQHLEALVLNVGSGKALQISRMSEDFTIIQDVLSTNQLLVEEGLDFRANESVLLADCVHAEIKTIQSIKREGSVWRVTLKTPLHNAYTSPMYIGEWLQERFFIDNNKQGEKALYYQLKHPEELSSHIKSMTVKVEILSEKRLVSLDFILDQGKTWHIETAVRL